MPPDLNDDGRPKNSVQHLILDSNEAVLLNAVVRETMSFFNFFAKNAKQDKDNADDTRTSWETLKARSLNVNIINFNNRILGRARLSYFI